jgi:hypothetical protein
VAAFWQHGAANLGAVPACGITETARQEKEFINNEASDGEVSEKSLEDKSVPGFSVPGSGRTGPFVGRGSSSGWKHQKPPPTEAIGFILYSDLYAENPGLIFLCLMYMVCQYSCTFFRKGAFH